MLSTRTPFLTKRCGVLSFIIGILIVGCASLPPEPAEKDMVDEILEDFDGIKHANELWKSDCLKYEQDLADWEMDIKACNEKEIHFIKGLSNSQLEIYSEYEESVSDRKLAKTELSLRKIRATLSDRQKNDLLEILEVAASLEERRKELLKRQKELTERKVEIANEFVRNEKWSNEYLATLGLSYQASHSIQNSVQQSLQNWQQSIQRQQLRMNLYSINQSLSDIASGVRGY